MHSVGPDTSDITQPIADALVQLARPGRLRQILQRAEDFLTLDPVPHLARISNFLADKAVEHASAKTAVPRMVSGLLSSVFPDSFHNPEEMAKTIDVLNKDNVLGIHDEFTKRANAAWDAAQATISSSHDAERQKICDLYVKAKGALDVWERQGRKGEPTEVHKWLDRAEAAEADYDKATGDTEATGTGRGKERAALREYFLWKNRAAAIGEVLNRSTPEYTEYDKARGAHDEARAEQLENAKKDAEQAIGASP